MSGGVAIATQEQKRFAQRDAQRRGLPAVRAPKPTIITIGE
ncbi:MULTISPECIES: hypothetical protein [Pontibacter]|nr:MULTISPECIES: hypothetical protein [Pontibacter]